LYDIRPSGNGVGLFLQPRSPHWAKAEVRILLWPVG